MSARPRITLTHATPTAVDPIRDAFAAAWPEAETVNLLEDSLSPDRARAGEISAPLADGKLALSRYAVRIGSDGILFTCSAFGSAIKRAAQLSAVPVLKPNEAMFEAVDARIRRALFPALALSSTIAPSTMARSRWVVSRTATYALLSTDADRPLSDQSSYRPLASARRLDAIW